MSERPRREPSQDAKQLRDEIYEDPLYSAADVAYVLSLDTSSVLRMIRNGELAALKIGRQYQIPRSEVRSYIKRAQDEEIGKIRVARAQREVREKATRLLKDANVARRIGITLCTNCTCDVLVELDTGSQYGIWRGRCSACEASLELSIDDVTSLADAETARIEKAVRHTEQMLAVITASSLAERYAVQQCWTCWNTMLLRLTERDAGVSKWMGKCEVCASENEFSQEDIDSIAQVERRQATKSSSMDEIPF